MWSSPLMVGLVCGLGLGGCVVSIAELENEAPGAGGSMIGPPSGGGAAGLSGSDWVEVDTGVAELDAGTTPEIDAAPPDATVDATSGPCATLKGFVDDFNDGTPASFWMPAEEGGAQWA